jgi:hypothetical protein
MLYKTPDQLGFCVLENVRGERMCGRFTLAQTTVITVP